MGNIHTLIDRKIGTLTVKSRTKNERGNRARFICTCDCGKEHTLFASDLLTGKNIECNCDKPPEKVVEGKEEISIDKVENETANDGITAKESMMK